MAKRTVNFGAAAVLLVALVLPAVAQQRLELAENSTSKTLPKPAVPALPASPAKPASVSLSPAVVMAKGSFGQGVTQTLMLTNDTAVPMSFELVAEDVVVENGRRIFVPAGQTKGSIAATAVFSAPAITVQPRTTGSVDVHFTVPQDTPVRAVVAVFRGTSRIASHQQGVAMTASLGTLITFTLSDNFKVSADAIRVAEASSATLTLAQALTNAGSEPIVPEGMVALLDDAGTLVMKAPIAAQRLLPGEQLDFQAQCAAAMLNPGKYRVLASYKFEGQTITESGELTLK
jgi:hypothetical protein